MLIANLKFNDVKLAYMKLAIEKNAEFTYFNLMFHFHTHWNFKKPKVFLRWRLPEADLELL